MWSSQWVRIVALLFVAALLLRVVWVYDRAQKAAAAAKVEARSARMRELAGRLGFAFEPIEDERFHERHPHEWLEMPGRISRWANNTLSGTLDLAGRRCPLVMGDYGFIEHEDKSTRTVQTSYILVHLPLTGVPRLLIRPESLSDRVAETLGGQHLDVGGRPFSDRFRVQCADPEFARALVTPSVARLLEAGDSPWVEIVYNELLVCPSDLYEVYWERAPSWGAADFRRRMEWVQRFYALWPVDKLPGVRERTDLPAVG